MTSKQITNAGQAWTQGASWGNSSGDNSMATEFVHLYNGTAQTLYTGDIVCIDVTGTQCVLATAGADLSVIGCVGAEIGFDYNITGAGTGNVLTVNGGPVPPELGSSRTESMGFTNGSATVTDTNAVATDLGRTIYTPYNASTNATPQIFTVKAVTPGTGYTVSANFTGTTGSFTCTIADSPSALGPGWGASSLYPVGVQVPIVIRGYGRVNVAAASTTAAKGGGLAVSASASVTSTYTAAASIAATQVGSFIAIPLEAYAARDLSLTNAGIAGHESVRGIIGKF